MLRRNKGFTLIEILVVILIIGLASSIIVLKTGNFYLSNKRSEVFARELTALIGLARSQAIFSSNTIGLRVAASEYLFLVLVDTKQTTQWLPLGAKDFFWRAREIPENMVVGVNVPGEKSLVNANDTAPQILIMPSGEVSPFTISVHKVNSNQTYQITGTYTGNITMKEVDQ
jgi:general secretion pathway protein H